MIIECLHRAGYVNTIKTDNGQEAWNYLEEAKRNAVIPSMSMSNLVVTDIEMPADGRPSPDKAD